MRKGLCSVLLALGMLALFGGIASAKCPDEFCVIPLLPDYPSPPTTPAVSLAYGQIVNGGASVFASLSDAAAGATPVNWLAPGFVFVSLADPTPIAAGNYKWYQLHEGGYVPANNVLPYAPSKFHGVSLDQQPDHPFGWVLWDTAVSSAAGARPAPGAPTLTRYTLVTLFDRQDLNGSAWYRVGDGQWLSQYRLAIVSVSPRPPAIGSTDKWIEVNLYEQTLAAYEGDQMVYATLVASGLPQWPTTPGLFHIYDKVRQDVG